MEIPPLTPSPGGIHDAWWMAGAEFPARLDHRFRWPRLRSHHVTRLVALGAEAGGIWLRGAAAADDKESEARRGCREALVPVGLGPQRMVRQRRRAGAWLHAGGASRKWLEVRVSFGSSRDAKA